MYGILFLDFFWKAICIQSLIWPFIDYVILLLAEVELFSFPPMKSSVFVQDQVLLSLFTS